MKLKGKVGRSDLEGGYFTFTAGSETYKLDGGGKDLLVAGIAAEVDGNVQKDAMGIGFGTATFKVKSYKIL